MRRRSRPGEVQGSRMPSGRPKGPCEPAGTSPGSLATGSGRRSVTRPDGDPEEESRFRAARPGPIRLRTTRGRERRRGRRRRPLTRAPAAFRGITWCSTGFCHRSGVPSERGRTDIAIESAEHRARHGRPAPRRHDGLCRGCGGTHARPGPAGDGRCQVFTSVVPRATMHAGPSIVHDRALRQGSRCLHQLGRDTR